MNKTIKVVPYDPQWPELFEAEAEQIKQALGDNCVTIHHIGSTSVPGLSAKPIIASIDGYIARKDGNLDWLHYGHTGDEDYGFKVTHDD